jgi:8-oxo-dGTP pyrophosphatase MutT (NUDIX family)
MSSDSQELPMSGAERNPWTVLETRAIYENPWISVVEHEVLTPAGRPGIYGVVSPKKLALGVVAFTDEGRIILVGQHRFPLGRYSWEIPEGGGDKDVPPQHSAARELREETGYIARDWQEILRLDLSNSVSDENAVVYVAWNLTPGPAAPDETEDLALREVSFGAALDMVMTGEITDAITVASLLKVKLMAARGGLPPEVLRHIHP